MTSSAPHDFESLLREFVPIVSHDVRMPLAALKGSAGLLATGMVGNLTQHQQKLVEICLRNSDIATLLVQDVVDVLRLETGIADIDPVETDLVAAVDETWDTLKGSTSLAMQIETFGDPSAVLVDHMYFRRMLQSLIRFPQGQPTVHEVSLSVKDTHDGTELALRCAALDISHSAASGDPIRAPRQVDGRLVVTGLELRRIRATAGGLSLPLAIESGSDGSASIRLTWPKS